MLVNVTLMYLGGQLNIISSFHSTADGIAIATKKNIFKDNYAKLLTSFLAKKI